ncbi:uncharacterized protein Dyro isoform X2 [Drosophila tropicalis]|uniref:uncharacterized protein Dyro isoform X2 n=1 Tax=Drosophila tropicalis TaxID=46794 RepID=UPI0035ABCF36
MQNLNKSGRKQAMTKRKCKRFKSVNAENQLSSPIKLATESSVQLANKKVSTVNSPVGLKPQFQYFCQPAGDIRLREWIFYKNHARDIVKYVRVREMSGCGSCPRLELSLYTIEHETELGILDRRTSTPSPINYYKATDLTYNHRKRKAQMDENGCDGVGGGIGIGIGVAGVGSVMEQHVVGALTLTPITKTATSQQMTNHRQLAFQALQQHFNHNHSGISINSSSSSSGNNNNISSGSSNGNNNNHNDSSHCNGQMHLQHHHQHHNHNHHHNHHHHQQQQQQHSNNMALKRDRDRDLSSLVNTGVNQSSTSLELTSSSSATGAAAATISSSSLSSGAATSSSAAIATTSASATPIKPSHIDEYGIFGEYVAITIRKLKTTKSKIVVKHLINNLLYEAELGKYDHGIPASKEPPQLYKMQ